MSEENKKRFWQSKWFWIIPGSLLLALFIRTFLLGSYRIPTVQMEKAVLKGDYILVDKTAYGIRLPQTWLSVPFLPDSIPALKVKTYSTKWQLPYKRVGEKKVNRNDVVVYNIPEKQRTVDKSFLSISRCIGLPGDSIEIRGYEYYINGIKIPQSPDQVLLYQYPPEAAPIVREKLRKLELVATESTDTAGGKFIYLSRYDLYLLKQQAGDSISIVPVAADLSPDYKLYIPRKNSFVKITPYNWDLYRDIITSAEKGSVTFREEKLYIDGKETEFYRFPNDYYWMLSDNKDFSFDSRHFGFIPDTHIIGKGRWVWLSKNPAANVLQGYNWKRCFTRIN